MGGELIELVINTIELTIPVGKGVLYLGSIRVETEAEETAADQTGPLKSHCTCLGYRRQGKRYARRFVAFLIGLVICVPLMVLIVWSIVRLAGG